VNACLECSALPMFDEWDKDLCHNCTANVLQWLHDTGAQRFEISLSAVTTVTAAEVWPEPEERPDHITEEMVANALRMSDWWQDDIAVLVLEDATEVPAI